ncbi:MAG: hypothetical protein RI907_93 [Pseudomonadota bacterium]|jgi:predicted Zn-dependent protease
MPLSSFARRWRHSVLSLACLGLIAPASPALWAQEAAGEGRWNPQPLPALGDAAAQSLSPMAERRLGDRIMRSLLRDPDVIDDPLVLEYVSQVWARLLAGAKTRGEIGPELEASHAWQPFLVRDKSVNAFALPGGYIGIHLGLLAMTATPDELASVLAHELSHVTQRHIARMLGQQSAQSFVSIASLLLGILAATRNAPAAAQAMIYGGQAAAAQSQLNFSRDMEREADRVGFGVLSDSGFDPAGMALMFEHLDAASRLNDDGSWPYLRTHPLTVERIGEAHARLGPNGWSLQPTAQALGSPLWAQHQLMAARARVLVDTRSESLATLSTPQLPKGATPLQAVTAWYMATLALQRSNQPEAAAKALAQARARAQALGSLQQDVVQRVLALAEVDGLLLQRRGQQALQALQADLQRPGTIAKAQARPELMAAAQAALATADQPDTRAWRLNALQDAASRLQTHVSDHPQDAQAWALLSSVWAALDQPVRAVRAEAESTAALGDLAGAIDRIVGARKRFRQPNNADLIELSVMDARLRTWQQQQRSDMREEGGGRSQFDNPVANRETAAVRTLSAPRGE